jgi:hypothetical protein
VARTADIDRVLSGSQSDKTKYGGVNRISPRDIAMRNNGEGDLAMSGHRSLLRRNKSK